MDRLKQSLSLAEQETKRLRRELREIEADPGSTTESGRALVAKVTQLEQQLSHAAAAHQLARGQSEDRVKQAEREQLELSQQVSGRGGGRSRDC